VVAHPSDSVTVGQSTYSANDGWVDGQAEQGRKVIVSLRDVF